MSFFVGNLAEGSKGGFSYKDLDESGKEEQSGWASCVETRMREGHASSQMVSINKRNRRGQRVLPHHQIKSEECVVGNANLSRLDERTSNCIDNGAHKNLPLPAEKCRCISIPSRKRRTALQKDGCSATVQSTKDNTAGSDLETRTCYASYKPPNSKTSEEGAHLNNSGDYVHTNTFKDPAEPDHSKEVFQLQNVDVHMQSNNPDDYMHINTPDKKTQSDDDDKYTGTKNSQNDEESDDYEASKGSKSRNEPKRVDDFEDYRNSNNSEKHMHSDDSDSHIDASDLGEHEAPSSHKERACSENVDDSSDIEIVDGSNVNEEDGSSTYTDSSEASLDSIESAQTADTFGSVERPAAVTDKNIACSSYGNDLQMLFSSSSAPCTSALQHGRKSPCFRCKLHAENSVSSFPSSSNSSFGEPCSERDENSWTTGESHMEVVKNEETDYIFTGLDEQQKEAVVADYNIPCLVVAGPGSGKTRVLTHRIAYLIRCKRVTPSSILAMTFTRNAAAEMRARLDKLLLQGANEMCMDETDRVEVNAKTYHALCGEILREFAIDNGGELDICSASKSRIIIKQILTSNGELPRRSEINAVISGISKIKKEKETVLGCQPDIAFSEKLLKIRSLYDAVLHDEGMLDFDDLLIETRRLLLKRPDVKQNLQKRFKYILVDEFQDTNNIQFDIITVLSGRKRNLFAVGDADQTIYSFSGSNIRNIQNFTKVFENANRIFLTRNYRSSGRIVKAAQDVIEQDTNREKKEMVTSNPSGEMVLLISVFSKEFEADLVTNMILDMRRQGKISSFSECAVLYRTHSQGRYVEDAFVQKEIPYLIPRNFRFFENEEILDMLAVLEILVNPSDSTALVRIMKLIFRSSYRYLIKQIRKCAKLEGKSLLTVIMNMTSDQTYFSESLKMGSAYSKLADCGKFIQQVQQFHKSMSFSSPSECFPHVGELLQKISRSEWFVDYLKAEGENKNSNYLRYIKANINKLIKEAELYKDISQFLEHTLLMRTGNDVTKANEAEAVWLTTMHGSKGLEFEAVFVLGANEKNIPLRTKLIQNDEAEERRLLYVAMTRAKHYLTLTWRAGRERTVEKCMQKLSPFLGYVQKRDVEIHNWIKTYSSKQAPPSE